jgi:predicted protein tyrosine phosphatase
LAFDREVSEMPGAHLLVHCRAGVSRSTAAAALILIQANPEWSASAALDAIAAIRPRAWPNLLILEFGDALWVATARSLAPPVRSTGASCCGT